MRVGVIGATGYVGGRLVPHLLEAGHSVRCLARTPDRLRDVDWRPSVEVVAADVLDQESLEAGFDGLDAVYYLVHAMGHEGNFAEADRKGAENTRRAAEAAGVGRIVYLGGLGDDEPAELSHHLASRHEVGDVLAAGSVPVTELRAAVIIGSGSASFEMLRHLDEVLPVMICPRWVTRTRCQPIAIIDVLHYLVAVLDQPATVGEVLEIGGPDVLTYREMMSVYAEEAGLRPRVVIPVPVLTPRLSSLWVGLVTPLPRSLARPLVDSLVNEVIVRDESILRLCPGPRIGYRESVQLALRRVETHDVTTSWSGAGIASVAGPLPTDPEWSGGAVLRDVRERIVHASPEVMHRTVCGVGGDRGWYAGEWLWEIRGLLDKIIGGPGMRRGRRDPDRLRVGDAVDFWRVENIEPDTLVRLRAEMRLPGVAGLEWQIESLPDDADGEHCRLVQTATFVPRGLWGRAYWYGVAPFHTFVFPGLIDGLAAAAEHAARPVAPTPAH